MSQYFPNLFEPFGGDVNVKEDISNYATEADIKNILHVYTSSFPLKTNLASLKIEVDKLNIGKLTTVPIDLSKLSDAIKNDVVKKTVYDKLVAKVNSIDTSGFVINLLKKVWYRQNRNRNNISDTNGFVKKTDCNTKITEIDGKIPNISSLATKTILARLENEIKRIYDTKITEIERKLTDHHHDQYNTTPEFSAMAASVFNARPAKANLVTKADFDNNVSSLNSKISVNK